MDLKCKINKSKSEGINEMYPVWLKIKTKRFHMLYVIQKFCCHHWPIISIIVFLFGMIYLNCIFQIFQYLVTTDKEKDVLNLPQSTLHGW